MNELTTDIQRGAQARRESTAAKAAGAESLPVWAAASELLRAVNKIVLSAPRKMFRFCDQALASSRDILLCIQMANIERGEARAQILGEAEAQAAMVAADLREFRDLRVISAADEQALRRRARSVRAQLAGWRASTKRECQNQK